MDDCISLQHVSQQFGDKRILNDINLTIPRGCIYGLLGPSGGGKTTMVKIAAGMLEPTAGQVRVLSTPMPQLFIMRKIGYMAQGDALYPTLTADQNLRFFGSIYEVAKKELTARIDEVLALVDLAGDRKKRVKDFSGGMKRRLSLAAALLHRPEILILDEPTVGIDPLLRRHIWDQLRQLCSQGTTILITTHVMDEAEKCDHLAMLRDGCLIAVGTPKQLVTQSGTESIEEAFLFYGETGVGAAVNEKRSGGEC